MTMTTTPAKTMTTKSAGPLKPVTPKPATPNWGATRLKLTLVVGSIVATLMGANLAARQDQSVTTAAITMGAADSTEATAPQAVAAVPHLGSTMRVDTTASDAVLHTPLAPIPSIVLPVVTSSQSSR